MNKQEVKKAIERVRNMDCFDHSGTNTVGNLLCKEIQIIENALEQQLSNGWIPVSVRLPEKYGLYIVSVHYSDWICDYGTEDEVHKEPENVVLMANYRKSLNCSHKWILYEEDGETSINGNEKVYNDLDYWSTYIRAWQPLPEPYKGE